MTDPSAQNLHITDMMRLDLQNSLTQSNIDPRQLSPFQRILLTTDGTVTEIIEAYYGEMVEIIKLSQGSTTTDRPVHFLDLPAGTEVLLRKVLLRGRVSRKNYIYAESMTVEHSLPEALQDDLRNTSKPLGRLMLENRLETFREILTVRRQPLGELSGYSELPGEAPMISRTYRVWAERKPIMLITESFPEQSFTV